MAFIRLVPHAYVFTPFGVAEVHFLETPDGFETNATWMCMQVETKEWWQWPTPMIRGCESISGMRDTSHSQFMVSDAYFETLRPHILRHKLSPLYGRAIMDNNRVKFHGSSGYDWMQQPDDTVKEHGMRPRGLFGRIWYWLTCL